MSSTQKIRFSYKGLENLSKSEEDRPAFVRFQVTDLATGETLVDFYTNNALEGAFVYDQGAASYRQILCTMCFRLPSGREAARIVLRRIAFGDFSQIELRLQALMTGGYRIGEPFDD